MRCFSAFANANVTSRPACNALLAMRAGLSSHTMNVILPCRVQKTKWRRRRDSNPRVLTHAYFPSMWNGPLSDSSLILKPESWASSSSFCKQKRDRLLQNNSLFYQGFYDWQSFFKNFLVTFISNSF